ncbi:sigma-70 family RNA polymerase sigma factor [Micromonospora maris]|uniref:RNA polymerase subunit sigma-70 n=1 Tax=Micromonospora maris TaxID=1003110 RepID=A0A9X0LCT9_9ACTN|nr:sigma-70 family RNA polymerase sigma factor [Micromonospora maris]AEB46182.1 ECF subfamily RNA polymerase sigma-24 factor [Micromonospora maris AB-18-032]KUJ45447.1 RNA polymerase subunit sigma-70 [Micromonospora maris]
MTEEEQLAAQFDSHRCYLHALAYRMVGSAADADDAVQEAWLRLARTGGDEIEHLRGWLTTVITRICLDALRKRRVRGEQPLEFELGSLPWEAVTGPRMDPEEEAVLAESVGLALYVVMDALTPAERVSFVLHDVFEIPFESIAAILGRSTAATKMLASRARGRLRLGVPPAGSQSAARDIVEAFFAAAGRGDVAALLAVLAPDVEMRARGPELNVVVRGASVVAGRATMFARPDARVHPAIVDGVPGVLVTVERRPVTVMAFTVTGGVITAIRTLTAPSWLAQIVPSWVT